MINLSTSSDVPSLMAKSTALPFVPRRQIMNGLYDRHRLSNKPGFNPVPYDLAGGARSGHHGSIVID